VRPLSAILIIKASGCPHPYFTGKPEVQCVRKFLVPPKTIIDVITIELFAARVGADSTECINGFELQATMSSIW
jgi:hypothetical protein